MGRSPLRRVSIGDTHETFPLFSFPQATSEKPPMAEKPLNKTAVAENRVEESRVEGNRVVESRIEGNRALPKGVSLRLWALIEQWFKEHFD